ncbi:hypothetical protein MKW92_024743 [Papaver armeniacum]|nr:hypothetical protein MKW92_024743 [Papaver armeniacum]
MAGNTSSLPFQNITNFVSVTLREDGSNYLIWKNQFESILITTDLFEMVDGSSVQPVKTIDLDGDILPNPLFIHWRKMNRFVMSCLNATLDETISRGIIGLSTARQIWVHLERLFTQQFSAKKSLLRSQLHSIKRGNKSISSYFNELKVITDSLAAIGERVDESDVVMYALMGLGKEYRQFVITAQNRDIGFSLSEIMSRLLHHEQ